VNFDPTKPSAVDVLQLRGMDTVRFIKQLGRVSPDILEEIVLAIGAVVEYP
jgi:mRNA interferase MazF